MQVPSGWRSTRWLSQILSKSVLGFVIDCPRLPARRFLPELRSRGRLGGRLLRLALGLGLGLGLALGRLGGRARGEIGLELARVELGGARHLARSRAARLLGDARGLAG